MTKRSKFCPKCKLNMTLHFGGKCPENDAMIEAASTANATQVGGDYYRKKAIQPWDFIAALNLNFFQGSIIEYVVRYKEKNGVQDLQKAKHYLEKLIEIESSRG